MATEKNTRTVCHTFLSRTKETERLYDLEHQRQELLTKITHEWLKVVGRPRTDFWKVGVPTMLYDVLGAWDRQASIAAAKEFLARNGG